MSAAAAVPGVPAGREIVRVYVWEVPVRVTHWILVLSLLLLSATGIYIGRPFGAVAGPAGRHFVMGTARALHFYAAIAFTLAVAARVGWMFAGNRFASWDKFLPVRRRRLAGLWPTFKFYAFLQRKPPGFVGHNPLAGLAYCGVFALYFLMIATGLALYGDAAAVNSPLGGFSALLPWLGGPQLARWLHHLGMWLLLGFAVHHVYSSVLMSVIEQNATLESIFSGYKFVPYEDLVHSGYRFRERPVAPPAAPEGR